ncbi:MAG: hypothetical protein LBP59_17525 [Planctomycetaceae bacterium]|jgi:hypothetical protein|nr:hypothetical protein [Planctomycetaceae bacterium]
MKGLDYIMTKNFWVSLVSVFFVMFRLTAIYSDETLRYEDAIKVMKSCEKKMGVFRWKFEAQTIMPGKSINSEQRYVTRTAEVLYDWKSKRFRIHRTGQEFATLPDNTTVEYKSEIFIAYDGSIYSGWKKSTPKVSTPNFYAGSSGEITNNLDNAHTVRFFNEFSGLTAIGLRVGVPCLFQPLLVKSDIKVLSEYLSEWQKENKIVDLFRLNDGNIVIYAKIYDEPISHYITKIVYSPNKNGIITEYSTLLSYSKESGDGKLYAQTITECKQNDNGVWTPAKISLTQPFIGRGINSELIYHNFEILSRAKSNEFQVTFPDETEVDDYITKKFYRVGRMVDEDKKIDEFIQRHGLTGDIPIRKESGVIFNYIFMSIGVLMVFIGFLIIIRKWRSKV